jgi:IS5 family transposase
MNKELLLIAIYCIVDDFCAQPKTAMQLHRQGCKPKLSDVSLLTLALFQEFSGIHKEDDYWHYVHNSLASYFPSQLVDRSQYHRRRKNLAWLISQLRQQMARLVGNPTNLHIIDCIGTTAMTVTKFFGSRSFPNAGLGYCASKKLYYAGYKTATIVAPTGVIEDFITGAASPHDSVYGETLLMTEGSGNYLGDKGFLFTAETKEELKNQGVRLTTSQRSNMAQTNTKTGRFMLKVYRRIVETVNGQLTEHFKFNRPGGKSERGLLARLQYKLAAHTVGLALLRQFHLPDMQLDLLMGLI